MTALAGTALSVVGLTWGLAAARTAERDAALALPAGAAVVAAGRATGSTPSSTRSSSGPTGARRARPRRATGTSSTATCARCPSSAAGAPPLLARAQSGLATGYVAWLAAGAVVAGVVGLVLS